MDEVCIYCGKVARRSIWQWAVLNKKICPKCEAELKNEVKIELRRKERKGGIYEDNKAV